MQRFPVIAIRNTTHGSIPRVPFEEMAKEILGARYELSLVVCGDTLARRMNREYRSGNYSPNVLSFPLDKNTGEVFLNIRKAEHEANQMNIPVRSRIAHLFVHGCFHLKGLHHSDETERREDAVLERFGFV